MGLVDGRNAVVTGAARGIGYEIAAVLCTHGARVVVADRDAEAARAAAARLTGAGGRAVAVTCDVTVPEDVDAAVHTCVSAYGSLDILVNNAGVTRDATLREMTLDDFELVVDVHLKGAWLGLRAASLVMREQGRGTIVNISSLSGKIGNPGQTNYGAAKAGVVGMTKAAAKELGHLGIRVNAVQPGLIRTAMTEAMPPHVWQAKEREVPLGRAGEPVEVANAVLFLASDLASYITGTVVEISGGRGI
ncbi:3-oxoacyl-ACP reductase FabG [Yinghuangia sp. ASG 101]|uniref:3-oxoacyl-ACP reductase FabG n=1 Tax=Yinghuangia sp. ASG 101 TaxID=2896848 RepID=UPI001E2D4D1E|nr:3-oxoacyl-ACP reductase FabG [Yinghuangia sp. ASG 101]UGQ11940.1 3-oxoacyl-ACP reductase FabG [Yinghuangia sp. ASG 101]